MTGVYRLRRNPAAVARAVFGAAAAAGNAVWPGARRAQFARFVRQRAPSAPRRTPLPSGFTRKTALAVHVRPPLDLWHQVTRAHPRIRATAASFAQTFNAAWPRPRSGKFIRLYHRPRAHPRRVPIYSAFVRALPIYRTLRRQLYERHARVDWESYRAAQWHLRGIGALKTSAPAVVETVVETYQIVEAQAVSRVVEAPAVTRVIAGQGVSRETEGSRG